MAAATANAEPNTAVVTKGEVRGSYVNVYEPKLNQLSKKTEYSMSVLIPKTDRETISQLKAAYEAALAKKWPNGAPANHRTPFRDGDTEKFMKDGKTPDPNYAGHYWINVKSQDRPGIVKLSQGQLVESDDPRDFSSGDYCRVSLNAYAYDNMGNKGVAFGLNNIMITRKGDPLGGGARPATDDFAEFADTADSAGGIDDLV